MTDRDKFAMSAALPSHVAEDLYRHFETHPGGYGNISWSDRWLRELARHEARYRYMVADEMLRQRKTR